jgi:hypothetical protein
MTQERTYSDRFTDPVETEESYRRSGNGDVRDYYTHHEPSLGELFSDLSRESSTLIREEIRLAQVEMTQKARRAGSGAAYLAAGGFIAYAGFIFLLLAATLGLSYFMWDWLAALIVGGVVAIIGGVLASSGLGKIKSIDPAPKQTIETLQEDKEWFKRQMK